jgi:hypothetical protein
MILTKEEEDTLAGENGRASSKAMQLLVALGEVMGADRLIPIESAQVSGVSYGNIGDAGMELLEDWSQEGARVKVKTTLNPAGMDLDKWREMGVDEDYHRNQLRIIKAFESMGADITCTCTPYLVGNRPQHGAHIAWSESSAIGYANSVLGALTNREGGPSALAAAIVGKTPRYGLHLEENRRPTMDIDVKVRLTTTFDFSLLGYTIGRIIGSGIPIITGIEHADSDRLKIMSAALAASGGIAMFHVKGVTTGGRRHGTGRERLCIDQREMEISRGKVSSEGEPDLACIGCPHCSPGELRDLARIVKGKKVGSGKGLWVWTSRGVYNLPSVKGYLGQIEKAGGKIFADTCMVVCPLEKAGFAHMVTNSCKAAHYVPSTAKMKSSVTELFSIADRVLEDR